MTDKKETVKDPKLCLALPRKLRIEFKKKSADEGMTMSEICRILITKYISNQFFLNQ